MSFNPMAWDCSKSGCFNEKKRLDFSGFFSALPGNISFTDVDATVEVNGHFLFIEWKAPHARLGTGQRIYFQRLVKLSEKISAIIVFGDSEDMDVYYTQTFHSKNTNPPKLDNDSPGLLSDIKAWADWAMKPKP